MLTSFFWMTALFVGGFLASTSSLASRFVRRDFTVRDLFATAFDLFVIVASLHYLFTH